MDFVICNASLAHDTDSTLTALSLSSSYHVEKVCKYVTEHFVRLSNVNWLCAAGLPAYKLFESMNYWTQSFSLSYPGHLGNSMPAVLEISCSTKFHAFYGKFA